MNGNDAAYPLEIVTGQYDIGLLKRELFAAMAMQGLLANPEMHHAIAYNGIAKLAIEHADLLIYHLNDQPNELDEDAQNDN